MRADSAVEPTKSENITVTWRRSAVSWSFCSGCVGAGAATESSRIARSIFNLSPSGTPRSFEC